MTFQVQRILNPIWRNLRYYSESKTKVSKTALYDFHVSNGGKMVNFNGYLLPLQYANSGIISSHLHTRRFASIFDISHMMQTNICGADCIECLESICCADIRDSLPIGGCCLTVFTNHHGHILDDLIVSKVSNRSLYVVSNAAMRQQDMQLMETAVNKFQAMGKDVCVEFQNTNDTSLIAIQGPSASQTLQQLLVSSCESDLSKLKFMNTKLCDIGDVPDCRVTRCGYTGEDGFEISIPSHGVVGIVEKLLQTNDNIKLAGLGARDSLRLEAGLCLYGIDIDNTITPVEASLSWLIAKRRRAELNFPGAPRIMEQLKNGVSKRRIGLKMLESTNPPPARCGAEIFHQNSLIGHVTSGGPSPILKANIAMGYIDSKYNNKSKNDFFLKIRNKMYPAILTAMPFVPTKYFTK